MIKSLSFLQEDYGLHKITKGNVEVFYIEGNHVTMMDNDKVVAIINEEHIESVKKLKLNLTDHDNITSDKDIYTRS
ncbi:hypothetical protein ACFW04_005722 [Cataglyphis niger]